MILIPLSAFWGPHKLDIICAYPHQKAALRACGVLGPVLGAAVPLADAGHGRLRRAARPRQRPRTGDLIQLLIQEMF